MTPFSKRKAGWLIPQNNKEGSLACFDAQCFKLFLCAFTEWTKERILSMFRCSMFWAFSLFLERLADKLYCYRVSMLNVLSFFFIKIWTDGDTQLYALVSMLNVLNFFFIKLAFISWMRLSECFDAQCSELFSLSGTTIQPEISLARLFRCSTFWAFSL